MNTNPSIYKTNQPSTQQTIKLLNPVSKRKKFNFSEFKRFLVPRKTGIEVFAFEDITYFKAESNYTLLYTKSGKSHLISKTLKWTERQLDYTFKRVHHSYVINMLHVSKLDLSKGTVLMDDGGEIPFSRSNKKSVVQMFKL